MRGARRSAPLMSYTAVSDRWGPSGPSSRPGACGAPGQYGPVSSMGPTWKPGDGYEDRRSGGTDLLCSESILGVSTGILLSVIRRSLIRAGCAGRLVLTVMHDKGWKLAPIAFLSKGSDCPVLIEIRHLLDGFQSAV